MSENDERTLSGKVKMGDIVELWKSIIEKYQEDGQCDFCWKFYAPLTELKLNLVRDVLVEPGSDDVNQACCVHVFLLKKPSQMTFHLVRITPLLAILIQSFILKITLFTF